jgi:nitrate reductase molybdenum cofactor assembly chaperone NarJ/NarW
MITTYKVLSALLSYPTAELQAATREMHLALYAERLLPGQNRVAVDDLIEKLAVGDLLDLQAQYVELFDRTRSLSLHMFEHVHGESRDRGQAMVSLLERYRQAGLDVARNELPDYIPLFLEFLSSLAEADSRASLAEPVHIFQALGERLKKRNSPYAAVLESLVALAQTAPSAEVLDELRKQQMEDPMDFAALDKAWEEAEVRFGPGDAAANDCPRASEMLRRMQIPSDKIAAGGEA